MQEIGLRLKKMKALPTLGRLDYDGNWISKRFPGRASATTVSIGIFRWEKMRTQPMLKRGKVFKRIKCWSTMVHVAIQKAEEICRELEAQEVSR